MSLALPGYPPGYKVYIWYFAAIPSLSLWGSSKISILVSNFYCNLVAFLGPRFRLPLVELSESNSGKLVQQFRRNISQPTDVVGRRNQSIPKPMKVKWCSLGC